ncbi:hypothetical protein M422DRAFT_258829 [Sphaerobolus stellatus SS14]|uniref:NADH dehydrogenase [ubiquinone] 1 alpha subcomplex subunit 5 n=1 Tax=Sphaerobolus stellatus (strain SS14) TaxID=990650 RepID=A0A0C9VLM0_SPHS4|nr:hypothetical protein M422DRAFT_258829 [Sphaerobolus stellatus SS14]
MFRVSRILYQQAVKASTGITGLAVHPNPLPTLRSTLETTLQKLEQVPNTSVYRQATAALTQQKLDIVNKANGDVAKVEQEIDQGQIEEILVAAQDEMKLVDNMLQWKPWEPLEEQPLSGQWEYFGKETSPS